MEFGNDYYFLDDTIAAIATAPGEGGIAVIRITGSAAIEIADRVFSGSVCSFASHTAHYGHVIDQDRLPVDDVLLLPMLGKRSFCGENTVEIHCHGGSLITKRVLSVVLQAGARAAKAGEFSYRAYMNGKIDLAQAEAVQQLIGAKNELALNAAEQQLSGALSKKIKGYQKSLTDIAAILEAWVDFPEEGLEFASKEEICSDLSSAYQEMEKLYLSYHDGEKIHEGISLCLVGRPNVGKSSLMNALLEKERAIVSDIPGTTRDIVEGELFLNGLNFRVFDTAGMRETKEVIEAEGIRRTVEAMEKADLVLFVVDGSEVLSEEEKKMLKNLPKEKSILIWNKSDLPIKGKREVIGPLFQVNLSAKNGTGLDSLKEAIDQAIWSKGVPSKDQVMLTNIRHKESLKRSMEACQAVLHGLKEDLSPEMISVDMREVLDSLGSVIGTNVTEDVLSSIFSKFCIGK